MPVCAICRSLLSMEGLCIGVYKKKNYNLDDSTEMIEKKPKSIITYGHALRTSQIWKRSWGGGSTTEANFPLWALFTLRCEKLARNNEVRNF